MPSGTRLRSSVYTSWYTISGGTYYLFLQGGRRNSSPWRWSKQVLPKRSYVSTIPTASFSRRYFLLAKSWEDIKSSRDDQIPAEMIQAAGKILRSEIRIILKYIYGMRKNCHSNEKSLLFCPSIKRHIKLTEAIIEICHCRKLHATFYSEGELHTDGIIGDHQRGFRHYRPTTDQMSHIRQVAVMTEYSSIMGEYIIYS
jgi:hypothetical protein